jgi:hypothetical protein
MIMTPAATASFEDVADCRPTIIPSAVIIPDVEPKEIAVTSWWKYFMAIIIIA